MLLIVPDSFPIFGGSKPSPGGRDFCRKSAHKLILATWTGASVRHRERGCRLQLLQQSPEFSLKFQVTHNYRWWITAGPIMARRLQLRREILLLISCRCSKRSRVRQAWAVAQLQLDRRAIIPPIEGTSGFPVKSRKIPC